VTDREDPPVQAGERELLLGWLDYHRATLAMKCDGLEPDQLRRMSVPPSTLSLLGLVRHMTEVERSWIRRGFADEPVAPLYYSDDNPDGDFDDVATADVDADFARWEDACAHTTSVVRDASSLDLIEARSGRPGGSVSLRWIVIHLIEEYARHNGHADLLRECVDGTVGD
jgi:hypothetical protein